MREHFHEYRKPLFILLGIILLVGVSSFLFINRNELFSKLKNDLAAIDPPEGLSYTDLDGNIVHLSSYSGKPLVINSWATWLPFSQTEIPLLIKMHSEYKDEITVLAINRMEHTSTIRAYLGTFGIPEEIPFLVDPGDTFYKAIGGYAMPETMFYDKRGVLVSHVRGVITEDELRRTIEELIAK